MRYADALLSPIGPDRRKMITDWTKRLCVDVGDGFLERLERFRNGMVVHGRLGKPCPTCGTQVPRISHATPETNYCLRCQAGGKLLADRVRYRLLKGDWPRTIEQSEGSGNQGA